MFKGYTRKDIFHGMLGSLLVIGIIMAYITFGGWGDSTSSQSPEPIHNQQERTVTKDVLKEFDDEYIEVEIEQLSQSKPKYEIYEVTAYTEGYESTGKTSTHPEYGITASGKRVQENVTIACPSSMEFGTKIYIPYFDNTFTCLDRGSSITTGRLDVYMKSRKEALNFGRRDLKIQILQ